MELRFAKAVVTQYDAVASEGWLLLVGGIDDEIVRCRIRWIGSEFYYRFGELQADEGQEPEDEIRHEIERVVMAGDGSSLCWDAIKSAIAIAASERRDAVAVSGGGLFRAMARHLHAGVITADAGLGAVH